MPQFQKILCLPSRRTRLRRAGFGRLWRPALHSVSKYEYDSVVQYEQSPKRQTSQKLRYVRTELFMMLTESLST